MAKSTKSTYTVYVELTFTNGDDLWEQELDDATEAEAVAFARKWANNLLKDAKAKKLNEWLGLYPFVYEEIQPTAKLTAVWVVDEEDGSHTVVVNTKTRK